jgi:cell division protein FtsB
MDKKLETIKLKFKSLWGYVIWIIVIILVFSIIKNINRVLNIRKQVQIERQRVEKMQAENVGLQAKINQAQGQDFIDKQIRDKLGLTKEGEAIVILPDESIVRSLAPSVSTNQDTLPDPNWKKWKKLFF